jgi:hypothetical protein
MVSHKRALAISHAPDSSSYQGPLCKCRNVIGCDLFENRIRSDEKLDVISGQINNEDDWNVQNDRINRAVSLLNGGLLKFDCVVKDLKRLSPALLNGGLLKFAHHLADGFDVTVK